MSVYEMEMGPAEKARYITSIMGADADGPYTWTWYDIKALPAGTGKCVYFDRAVGYAGVASDETNLTYAGCMAPNDYFVLGAIRVCDWSLDQGLFNLNLIGGLELMIRGRSCHQDAPLGEYMAHDGRKMHSPLLISALERFEVRLIFSANFLSHPRRVGVYLDGVLRRRKVKE